MKLIGRVLTLMASFGALVALLFNYGIINLKQKRKVSFLERLFLSLSALLFNIFGCRVTSKHKKGFNGLYQSILPFFSK